LCRGRDDLCGQCCAAGTDHVANGYSFTDTGFDDATWSDELRRKCCAARTSKRVAFTDTGIDDATWSDGPRCKCCAARTSKRVALTDTGINDATLTVTTVATRQSSVDKL
jgi:hypothetical protein